MESWDDLKLYVEKLRPLIVSSNRKKKPCDYLFLNFTGNKISSGYLLTLFQTRFQRFTAEAGITKRFTFRKWRFFSATNINRLKLNAKDAETVKAAASQYGHGPHAHETFYLNGVAQTQHAAMNNFMVTKLPNLEAKQLQENIVSAFDIGTTKAVTKHIRKAGKSVIQSGKAVRAKPKLKACPSPGSKSAEGSKSDAASSSTMIGIEPPTPKQHRCGCCNTKLTRMTVVQRNAWRACSICARPEIDLDGTFWMCGNCVKTHKCFKKPPKY